MELKAKNMMATAMKYGAHEPTCTAIDACVKRIPFVSPVWYKPPSKMMKAVAEQMMMVSKNTPRDCTRPCFAGCDTFAVAAAFGTLPIPASLEKRPRRTPCIMAIPIPPPMISLMPNACSTINVIIAGISVMFNITIYKATII